MKKLTLPRTLVLDYKVWNAGQPEENSIKKNCHGKGDTCLRNKQKTECCLGQFARQAGCPTEDLIGHGDPNALQVIITGLTYNKGRLNNTKLTVDAIGINDSEFTTLAEKVSLLVKRFRKDGYTIQLKNFPKKVLAELDKAETYTILG